MKGVKDQGRKARRIDVTGSSAPKIAGEVVAGALGADETGGHVHLEGSLPAFTALRDELRERLRSSGGRPKLAGTVRRQKVPMRESDWGVLTELAALLKERNVRASPGQVASAILHYYLNSPDVAHVRRSLANSRAGEGERAREG